ncbi:MAG TPA: transcriptional repressor [Amaricoccus sp.]|uniref:transcriptional repressor n=1 Tax=Amaricoccus sp. TaxID=1872485 RepID=UPI002CC4F2C7|nr:transcriptional repressor [Amaricoccus sp.]HMQ92549.1 transcriptional repressor [Amaricoccus sp.]HMR52104.1 transcriptional repressor [Amaricoccus sp.]HMR60133.1 transcriptional repressor [Amaricoccus sp.]HMT98906.1 transcriptional repressor [Amaricoccus sp.]
MTRSSDIEAEAFGPHDHKACRAQALAAVEAACAARRLRMTPARACVLEALLEAHRAMTAYELLDRLREAGLGSQPPVAYRALDFLVRNGFVHRIERLSAFVACTHGGAEHVAVFLICRSCRGVAEAVLPQLGAGLAASAAGQGFCVERMVIEGEGLCARCREAEAA